MTSSSTRRAGLRPALLFSALAAVPAGAQQLEPASEAQLWRPTAAWGRPAARCLDFDGDGYPEGRDLLAPARCPADAPLAPDELYAPMGVAVYDPGPGDPDRLGKYRVYVADLGNHRIASFDYRGRPLPPIGSGGVGVSPLGEIEPPFDGGAEYPDGQLLYPESVAVDAAGAVVAGDTYNGRLQVFGPDGAFRFAVKMPIAARPPSQRAWPSQLAVRPGTIVRAPAADCSTPGEGRIAVSTWSPPDPVAPYDALNQVVIFDEQFCVARTVGQASPYGLMDTPGSFAGPAGVAFDAAGRLAVADFLGQKVEVFPAGGARPSITIASGLRYPYGVMFDASGRLAVADAYNHRLSLYELDFARATSRFVFDLTAAQGLGTYPQSSAEDRDGRRFVTAGFDTVHVLEMPALAVVDAASSRASAAVGSIVEVRFTVAVPPGGSGVTNLEPTIGATGNVERLQGPLALTPVPFTLQPGATVTYGAGFRIVDEGSGEAMFTVGARGNPGHTTVAPGRTVRVAIVCGGCEDQGPAVTAQPAHAAAIYNAPVDVRLEASDAATGRSGVAAIYAKFSGPEVSAQPEVLEFVNGGPHTDPFAAAIRFTRAGTSTVEVWAVDTLGNPGPRRTLGVTIDLAGPQVFFDVVTPPSGASPDGRRWWNRPAQIDVQVGDDLTAAADIEFLDGGPILRFDRDGAGQAQQVRVRDAAGNTSEIESSHAGRGGMPINVDTVPPATMAPPGGRRAGPFTVDLVAADTLSGVKEIRASLDGGPEFVVAGPVAITTGGSHVLTFRAVDWAGNIEAARQVAFSINRPPRALPDLILMRQGGTATADVLRNDSDEDGDPLSLVSVTDGAHGQVRLAGPRVLYTPARGFRGLDRFTYTVTDPHGGTATGTVYVLVSPRGRD